MDTTQTPHLEHQRTVAFKIWYGDGTTYTSNDGRWDQAPNDNVQVVMLYFKGRDGQGRYTRLYSSGCDNYAMDEQGRLTSHFDDPTKVRGHLLSGRFMRFEDLVELEKRAFLDYGEDLTEKPINELITWQPTS